MFVQSMMAVGAAFMHTMFRKAHVLLIWQTFGKRGKVWQQAKTGAQDEKHETSHMLSKVYGIRVCRMRNATKCKAKVYGVRRIIMVSAHACFTHTVPHVECQ